MDSGFATSDDAAIGVTGMAISLCTSVCSFRTVSIEGEPVTPSFSFDAMT